MRLPNILVLIISSLASDVLAQCPWIPVIGNHESTMGEGRDKVDAGTEERYLNQSWGVIFGQDGAESATGTARTRATTSLGHLLTRSSFYGGGSHGAAPSRTSQWYSVDLGPSRAKSAPRSLRRVLLMPQVNPASRYRCG